MSIQSEVASAWKTKTSRMDVEGLENTLVAILRYDMPDAEKIAYVKECIDAFTKRGHFRSTEYPQAGQWECPECENLNARSITDVRERGWIGSIQCGGCKRRFELDGLYRHGFVL